MAAEALTRQVAQRERRLLLLELVHGCECFSEAQRPPLALLEFAARLQEGVLSPLLLQLPAHTEQAGQDILPRLHRQGACIHAHMRTWY